MFRCYEQRNGSALREESSIVLFGKVVMALSSDNAA